MIRFYLFIIFLSFLMFCSCNSHNPIKIGDNIYRYNSEVANALLGKNDLQPEKTTHALHPVVIDVAKQYHIVADSKTDNTLALQQLNKECKGADKPFFRFIFPEGEVRYSDNTWLSGIDSFEVIAKATTFRCTSLSDWDVAKQPFFSTGIYCTSVSQSGEQLQRSGQLFQSVKADAKSITLATPSEATCYKKGDKIYLAGYEEQMWGYPPNPRFFEWHTVTDVNIDRSLIFLDTAIKYSYNEHWKDVDNMLYAASDKHFGKPRIFNISSYPRYARFVGCVMGNGVHVPAGKTSAFMFPAERLICEEVQIEGQVWPTENRFATYINCSIGSTDLDKNCEVVEFRNCKFKGGVMAATGIDSLILMNCIINNYSALSPRILYAEGNHFNTTTQDPCLYPHPEFTHTDKVYLKNNSFNGIGNKNSVHTYFNERSEFLVTALSGNDLLVKDGSDPQSQLLKPIKGIGFGTIISSKDGAVTGEVKDMEYEGGNWIIKLYNIKGKPVPGQIWQYYQTDKVIDLGGNIALDHKPLWKLENY